MIEVLDIGTMVYGDALEVQREVFDGVQRGVRDSALILVEHPHVYTLGKSGREENLLIGEDFLRSIDAEYYRTDRGGDITYHGYGQLVGYPILRLDDFSLSLRGYIELLEQSLIEVLDLWGIESGRVEGATGVWVEQRRKIAAIGVRASRGVTMHGFALNISTDLRYFSYINPCGFVDRGVTSLKEEGVEATMAEVKVAFVDLFRGKVEK